MAKATTAQDGGQMQPVGDDPDAECRHELEQRAAERAGKARRDAEIELGRARCRATIPPGAASARLGSSAAQHAAPIAAPTAAAKIKQRDGVVEQAFALEDRDRAARQGEAARAWPRPPPRPAARRWRQARGRGERQAGQGTPIQATAAVVSTTATAASASKRHPVAAQRRAAAGRRPNPAAPAR